MLSTVGSRQELGGLALWGHIFCAAFRLRGRIGSSKGHGEDRRERTDTSPCRSAPTEHGGFQVGAVWVLGP